MKSALLLKTLRDMRLHIGAYIACALVMAIGVIFYSSMTQVVNNIPKAQQDFYEKYRFADAFASVNSMPASRLSRLEGIDGVQKVSGRLVATVRVAGDESNTDLKLISYDPQDDTRLNDIYVTNGAAPSAHSYAICLSEGFYKANELSPGDTLVLSIMGSRVSFAVSGSCQTPEYIYIMPEGSLFPDDKHFGIAYVPLDIMGSLLGQNGEVNDISFSLKSGVAFDDVKKSLESALAPYGMIRLTERKDQASHSMMEMEIEQMGNMVSVVPVLFLMVGALIMSVVIKRLVEQQHTQIGILKAFGYSNMDVLGHYAVYGVVIGLMASVIGGSMGALVASYMAELYTTYFTMPGITGAFSISNVFLLSALALFFGVGASLYGARSVLKLKAAEAMRPPAPPSGKPILIERIRGLWVRLRSTTQMSLRNLFRARSRSVVTLLGLLVCYALTAAVFAFGPMMTYMMTDNFYEVQRFDLKILLSSMANARSVEKTLEKMQGVQSVEAVAEIPVTLRAGARAKDVTLLAVSGDAQLYRLFDKQDKPVQVPSRGAVLTYRLAEDLGVSPGDKVLLDMAFPDKEAYVTVAALGEQYTSNYVVVERAYLASLLRMQPVATGAMISVASGDEPAITRLREQLDDARYVNSVMDVAQIQANMNELMATSMSSLYVMAMMAVFAGFAIVYNASVVILSERMRELASMRIMGFSVWETIRIVSLEQLLLCVGAMIGGIPLAGATMQALVNAMSTDAYTIPATIPLSSHLTAILCMLGAWLVAITITSRKLRRLSMVDVLKDRD